MEENGKTICSQKNRRKDHYLRNLKILIQKKKNYKKFSISSTISLKSIEMDLKTDMESLKLNQKINHKELSTTLNA